MRKSFGAKSITKGAGAEVVAKGKGLEEYFTISKKEMEVKRSVVSLGKRGQKVKNVETCMVIKDIFHPIDFSEYVKHLFKEKGLNPDSFIRVGMDGGGDSMKILLSVFDIKDLSPVAVEWQNVEMEGEN